MTGSSAALDRARASLDGLSVGDAFGERFFAPLGRALAAIEARDVPRPRWSTTDDTEMALGVVEVLARQGRLDPADLAATFARRYARRPARGYGRGAVTVLEGIAGGEAWRTAARRAFGGSGSMGNGGAMRVAPLGAFLAEEPDEAVIAAARLSAEVTHAHPEGQAGAVAVALAAAWAARRQLAGRTAPTRGLIETAHAGTPAGLTRAGIAAALEIPLDAPVDVAARRLGTGAEVLASDTVPFTLWCAARHIDGYVEALWTTVAGLGDRDTTCAIVGGIVAAGGALPPPDWLEAREPLDWDGPPTLAPR